MYYKEYDVLNILLLSSIDSSLKINKLRFTQSYAFLKSINAQKVGSIFSFLVSIIVVKFGKWSMVLRPFLKPFYSSFITSMSSRLTVNWVLRTPQYRLYATGTKVKYYVTFQSIDFERTWWGLLYTAFDIFVCIKPLYDIGSLASDVDDFGIITPHSRHFTAKNNHIWKIQVIALNAAGVVFLKYILVYNSSSWSWSYGSWIYNYLCNQLWVRIPLLTRCTRYKIMC